jgi:phage terminase large subunit-like protein
MAADRILENPLLGEGEGKFWDITSGVGRVVTGETPAWLGGEASQNLDQDFAVMTQANRKAVTGAGASVEELKRLVQEFKGQGSQREIKRKVEQIKKERVQDLRAIMSGMAPAKRAPMLESIKDPAIRAKILEE